MAALHMQRIRSRKSSFDRGDRCDHFLSEQDPYSFIKYYDFIFILIQRSTNKAALPILLNNPPSGPTLIAGENNMGSYQKGS